MATQSKEAEKFFLILTAFFGLYVRLFPVLKADFPLVDGGMFYTMIKDLQAAHFSLPAFTTYNQAQIPFAYPPLAFYLTGIINSLTGIPLLGIIQWQPLLISILTLPVFYYLVRQVTGSETRASLGTLIFALTPNSYWWNIVGGGLTRSLGALFFTLAAISAWKMYREKKRFGSPHQFSAERLPCSVIPNGLCNRLLFSACHGSSGAETGRESKIQSL